MRPFDGGSAAAAELYQLGANVPPSAAMRAAVRHVVERRRGRVSLHRAREHVEVLVVALDEVERRPRREVLPVVARDIADADPDQDIGVPLHDEIDGVELAVDVA